MGIPAGKKRSEYTFPEFMEASGLTEEEVEYILFKLSGIDYKIKNARYIGRKQAQTEERAWELLFDRELRISVGWLGNARSMGQWIKKKHINYEYLKKDLILEGGFICIELPVKAKNGLGRFVFVTAPNQKCIAPNEGLVNGLVFNIDEENDENSF